MTKREIYQLEQQNTGRIILFLEGMFYKAYERSAYFLCTQVQPFKVSARPLKGQEESLVSVGFPMSSLEKFKKGMTVEGAVPGQPESVVLRMETEADLSGFSAWKKTEVAARSVSKNEDREKTTFNNLQVYGSTYRLVLEITELCAGLDRRFRYSLGEDLRNGAKQTLMCIMWAGKGEDKLDNIIRARHILAEVQLGLRLLNDLKVITDKRYVPFLEQTEDISNQLSKWERFCRHDNPPECRHPE